MNILFLELQHQNFHLQKELMKEGHTIYTDQCNQAENPQYYESFGIKPIKDFPVYTHLTDPDPEPVVGLYSTKLGIPAVRKIIEKYKIDFIWCSAPHKVRLLEGLNIPMISPTTKSIRLETDKWYSRTLANECGIALPNVLATGDSHLEFEGVDVDVWVIKPKHNWHSACINMIPDLWNQMKSHYLPVGVPYYVEEMVKGIETNISYIMSNGKWAFTFSEICDESPGKHLGNNVLTWYKNTQIDNIPDDLDKRIRENVTPLLNECAKLGGQWEGSITQMLGEDDELYFIEHNCRPYVHNTFGLPMGGNEYMDAFQNNPQKIGDCFTGRKFPKVVFQSHEATKANQNQLVQCPYPMHLHNKYSDVPEPTGLSYINGDYMIKSGAFIITFNDKINMDFVEEMKKETGFIANWGD
tara:strand:- start:109 stop:1344 length:1236 start_codon:yes stop_codon:yes gene_type:complete